MAEAAFNQAIDPANWMAALMPQRLSDRSFATICVPRSHDSGTYTLTHQFRLGTKSTVQTHETSVRRQLELGFRSFDIRPIIWNREFFCGHYTFIKEFSLPKELKSVLNSTAVGKVLEDSTGWHSGGAGVSIDDLVDQVNTFTAQHNEAIILDVSHAYNFDREKRRSAEDEEKELPDPGDFNVQDWQAVIEKLKRLNHRFVRPAGSNAPVKDIKFNDMIDGKPAVVVLVPKGYELVDQGFYNRDPFVSLPDWHPMHMQETFEAVFAFIRDFGLADLGPVKLASGQIGGPYVGKGAYSILEQAVIVQDKEMPELTDKIGPGNFPNTISIDHIRNDDVVQLVHKIFR